MEPRRDREAEQARIEAEIAEVCGILNAATGRLVDVIAKALEAGTCEGDGIHSPQQWVGWKCGLGAGRARKLVAMAKRLGELPEVGAALRSGELSEDQAAVACRYAPAFNDAEVATLARSATVAQLSRAFAATTGHRR